LLQLQRDLGEHQAVEAELDEVRAIILFLDVEPGHVLEHLADLYRQARRPAGSLRILNAHRWTPGRIGGTRAAAHPWSAAHDMEYAKRGAFRPASFAVAGEPVLHAVDQANGFPGRALVGRALVGRALVGRVLVGQRQPR